MSEVEPDGVNLQFLIESTADAGSEAVGATTAKYSAIVSALVGAGFRESDIRTTRYVVEKREMPHRYQNEEAKIVIVARHGIELSLNDFAKIGDTVNKAVAAGATYVTNIAFTSTQRATKETEALRHAAGQARASAAVLAEAAGGRLGRLIEMQSEDFIQAAPDEERGGQITSVPVVIYPSPIRYRINVRARWEMIQ